MNYFSKIIFGSLLLLISISSLFGQTKLVDSLNQKAYQNYRKNVQISKAFAYQALSIGKAQNLPSQMVDSYINLSRCFRLENQWDSAYFVLDIAISLAKKERYISGLMNANNNLALCFLGEGKNDSANIYLKQSLVYAQALNDTKGQANAFNNLSIIAQDEQENDSALAYLDGAMAVYQQIQDSSGISRTYLNKAFIFDLVEKNDSAISYNMKALRIQEALGLDYQRVTTLNQIGDLYMEKRRVRKSLPYFKQALTLIEEIGDLEGMATANMNVGVALNELDQNTEAFPFLEKALQLARQSENHLLIGNAIVSLANWYEDQPKGKGQAELLFREAIPLLEAEEAFALSSAYNGLGEIEFKRNQFRRSQTWFIQGLEVAEYFEDLDGQLFALNYLTKIYIKNNQTHIAIEYFDRLYAVKDCLINLQSLATINELNIEYESEKKEKENLILQNELTQSELEAAEQKILRNKIIGIASFILFLGLGGFIWFRYRQRIRIKEQEIELEQERARKEQRRKEAEKLKELDEMKTRFFTNISHEFRTPLTLILGQNEQLQAAVEDKDLQSRFQMVDRNGHRLLDLVNQVLDVAKLEAGGMKLESSKLDAIPFLKHMLYSFESMAQEKEIKIEFENNQEQLLTAFDIHRMERVFFNLLSNALKFTPKDGTLTMLVKREDQQMIVGVKDTGIGIKKEQIPYLFDRFYQADSSENQAQPGTGIGLSLVKELVDLHQGKVWVESELNQGTTFWVQLPIPEDLSKYSNGYRNPEKELSTAALPSKNISEGVAASPVQTQAQSQILLIEDNADIRAYVRDQLISFGYQIIEAENGIEGLELAKKQVPDLIISDIMMPKLDGYGVAKGLKEDERTSHIPLILLTSKASDESKIAGFELGIDDYLLKPFNSKELQARVLNLIEQRKHLRERFSSATVIRPNEVSAIPMDQTFLKKVLETVENHLTDEQFGVEMLSEKIGMSVTHLNRKLNALVDQPAGKLIRSMRLQRAADLLKQKAITISEVAYDLGFSNPTHFTRSFKKQFGVSPSEYQKG